MLSCKLIYISRKYGSNINCFIIWHVAALWEYLLLKQENLISSNVLFFNARFSPFDINALYCSLRSSPCVIFCFLFFEIEGFSSTTTVRTAYDVEMRHLRLILLAKTASGPKNNHLLSELKREQNKHLKKGTWQLRNGMKISFLQVLTLWLIQRFILVLKSASLQII